MEVSAAADVVCVERVQAMWRRLKAKAQVQAVFGKTFTAGIGERTTAVFLAVFDLAIVIVAAIPPVHPPSSSSLRPPVAAFERKGVDSATFRADGDARHYTAAALRARRSLRRAPRVVAWLDRFYNTFASTRGADGRDGALPSAARADVIAAQVRFCKALFAPSDWSLAEVPKREREEEKHTHKTPRTHSSRVTKEEEEEEEEEEEGGELSLKKKQSRRRGAVEQLRLWRRRLRRSHRGRTERERNSAASEWLPSSGAVAGREPRGA